MKNILFVLCLTIGLMSFRMISVDQNIQDKNLDFIKYLEANGKKIAPTYKKANCVQFMDQLLTGYINIDEKTAERIYIKENINYIEKLLKRGDSTIVTGVCWALVASGKANWVNPKDAKNGDIIQYWCTDGFTNGHCGVLYGQDKNGYVLLGSHPDSNGYGTMSVNNKLFSNMKIFIVRLK